MHKYGLKTIRRYNADLKYWSSACGELHQWGIKDITEDELPDELKKIYHEWWEENKDGNYCYLAEYRGIYGIALVNEYHELYEGKPYEYNYELAEKVAKYMDALYGNESEYADLDTKVEVLLAKAIGFPCDEDMATEVVVFVPAGVEKSYFDEISKKFAKIAYNRNMFFRK